MGSTQEALRKALGFSYKSLWQAFYQLCKRFKGKTLERRVTKVIVTSDSYGGLCDHPTQPSFESCGIGLVIWGGEYALRQKGNAWEIIQGYLREEEKILGTLKVWEDLEDNPLDEDIALWIKELLEEEEIIRISQNPHSEEFTELGEKLRKEAEDFGWPDLDEDDW